MYVYKTKIVRGGSVGYVEIVARSQQEAKQVAEVQNPGARALLANRIDPPTRSPEPRRPERLP